MGIAIFTFNSMFAPLQGLLGWFMGAAPAATPRRVLLEPARTRPACSRTVARPVRPSRPLRVLRVVDGCHASTGAGRMVISGRMADVCAELDRLAELEATLH